jgi:hypothetical protein
MVSIALVGTCPSSRMLAPYANGDWEIWTCSPGNAFGQLPRVTGEFQHTGGRGAICEMSQNLPMCRNRSKS